MTDPTPRRCRCGRIISIYNPEKDCFTCQRRASDAAMERIPKGKKEGQRGQREFCPQGHRYSEANTRINTRGHRECRQCMRERRMKYYIPKPRAVRYAKVRPMEEMAS